MHVTEAEHDERLFQALTLLVAVCEQVTQELSALENPPLPLVNRLDETRNLSMDLALSLDAAKR